VEGFLDFLKANWLLITDCVIAVALYLLLYLFFKKFKLNMRQYAVGGIVYLVLFIGLTLHLRSIAIVASGTLILFLISFASNFRNDIRKFFYSTNFKKASPKNPNRINEDEKEYLLDQLESALLTMSTDQIGAIITIERNQSLDEYIKKAVTIHSVVTTELLLTIFYPGTALHDGAVVIRGNKIEAAAVYFTISTKILSGKFGARHRAALGISEVSDAVTLVVSEETGRISFTKDGELEPINRDNLHKILKDLLDF
jgi:diadenylate cyclase